MALDALLENAIRHTGPVDDIVVDLRTHGGSVKIVVEDSGEGIDEQDLSRIFDRYVRSRERGGTGLGLAMAKAIADAHGGTIEVQSRRGEGARFTITLPGYEAPTEGAVSAVAATAGA